MKHDFTPVARLELLEAVNYYESQGIGLGAKFSAEVWRTIERMEEDPYRLRPLPNGARRCLTHIFPYSIVYEILAERIVIVAIAHGSRRPGYWSRRLKRD